MPNADAILIQVTLARAASCDACTLQLSPGARAHWVRESRRARIRCLACFESGASPPPDPEDAARAASAAPLTLATPVALTRGNLAASIAVLGAAAVAALIQSPTARRLAVTLGVAVKSAFAMLRARRRGERNSAPAILRRACEDLGPTYIKLAQLVASSEGLFPEPYCIEFRACLDRVRPFGFADVERTLRDELGRSPNDVFSAIDEAPLASASIAQVHAARLRDGTEVVLKVQRPRIAETIASDLRILKAIARLAVHAPNVELANPVDIVADFEANLREELDFVREASNMDEFNRIMKEHHQTEVAAPRVMHSLTTKRVLVMERFHGHRVDDVERLRARAVDGEEKLLVGMRAWFQCMIFHGFFHGDVHAGNLMALADGRIGFLDFGIVGRFAPERRTQVTDYLLSFASADFRKLAETMVAMGSVDRASVDLEALTRDLEVAYAPLVSESADSVKYADLIPAVMRTSIKHRMRLPRDFVLVTKQMVYFDRYAKVLAPKLNIFRDPRIVSALAMDVMMAKMQSGLPA